MNICLIMIIYFMIGTEFGIKRYLTKRISIAFIKGSTICMIFPFWKDLSKQKRIIKQKEEKNVHTAHYQVR